MVAILKKQKKLSLQEIIQEILKINPEAFTGKTPVNSLYSIVYHRGKSRLEHGKLALFISEKIRNSVVYSINPKNREFQ